MAPGKRLRDLLPLAGILKVLVYAAVLTVVIALYRQAGRFGEQAPYLSAGGAPRSLMSLQLPHSEAAAAETLAKWSANGSLGCALTNLDLDRAFIALYALLGFLVAVMAIVSIPGSWRTRRLTWVLVALPLMAPLAGAADVLENRGLLHQIALTAQSSPPVGLQTLQCPPTAQNRRVVTASALLTGDFGSTVNHTRAYAIVKFTLLIGATAGLLMIAGVWIVRLRTRGSSPEGVTNGSLEALMNAELTAIRPARPDDQDLKTDWGPAREQWVRQRNSEVVGLGLSGGGIRSATFNLGLLQGLARLHGGKMLEFIDYLSTVSGGGYVGGAWSAFCSRNAGSSPGRDFFIRTGQLTTRGGAGETEPVRHLREFSNFLVPRWGFFSVESWQAIVVIIDGLLPSLLVATSLLVLSLLAYVGTTSHVGLQNRVPGIVVTTIFAALILIVFEAWWRRDQGVPLPAEKKNRTLQNTVHVLSSALALLLLTFILLRMGGSHEVTAMDPSDRWAAALGIDPTVDLHKDWWRNWHLFDSALATALCSLMLLAVRWALMLVRRTGGDEPVLVAFDRTLMRMVGLSVLFAGIAAVWHLGVNFQYLTSWMLALTAGSGGAFALLRNWLTTLQKPESPGLVDRIKPYLPQVLAYATIVLAAAVIVSVLVEHAGRDLDRWLLVTALAVVVLTMALFVDPQTFGFHSFYRDRIARAYLGASNPLGPTAEKNRQFYVRPGDDIDLETLTGRPLHLVCCAANDLAADPVASLSRGARSAVLSQQGIAISDTWASVGRLSLASALTASAAAFNSNMGSVSVKLGPAVTFLMSALNLRLGLWVRHPASKRQTPLAMPGLLFYREMFQATAVSDQDDVHLSDGAHFDNLGLYELVRRHCRYVIISDASADPDVAFDDFGIAARKIRQDFGVDIHIDLAPLKPGTDGYSRQHMVVGSIDYGPLDQGILLYIKPTLTGDEEPDIRQYRRRNDAFPHESTGDQFYDEAQWESYRRLGDHVAEAALRFLDRLPDDQLTPRGVFTEARREWYPTSPDLATRVIGMTSRLTTIEGDLRSDDAATIALEVFPELRVMASTAPAVRPGHPKTATREETANLAWLLRILQLMEDTWVQCDLDTHWNHPLNLGWMNVFARWATAPTFQMWWPVLSPMYGSGFLRFMHERFPVLKSLVRTPGEVRLEPQPVTPGIASTSWPHVLGYDIPVNGQVLSYWITLTRGSQHVRLQVGLVALQVANGTARWEAERLFVPPSLWNGGIGSAFLSELLKQLPRGIIPGQPITECRVTISETSKTDPASVAERMGYLDFYQPQGFSLERPAAGGLELVRKL